jgi:hypothetical protein
MTPLGRALLTGMPEVEDPTINDAMCKMLGSATPRELSQTLQDMSALVTALCGALGECSNTSSRDVLDCVLLR